MISGRTGAPHLRAGSRFSKTKTAAPSPSTIPDRVTLTVRHASDPLLRLTSGNSARRKTCLRLSFQQPLTPVEIQAVASRVLAAPESSCETRDAGVPNEVFARGWQADASRKPGPRFCTGIA